MKRRTFVNQLGSLAALATIPETCWSFTPHHAATNNFSFGIIADAHKDLVPDANDRLAKFIDQANSRNVDFIIQLGDFCMGISENQDFMGIWHQYKGPKYHVLGNHDMDKNSKSQMLDYWAMPKTYYSWDFGGLHFVVLDANFLYQNGAFIDYDHANFYVDSEFRTYINPEQLEWFKADLQGTELPTIVFSHQSLWHYQWGVKNRLAVQNIMEDHASKIICCMNGHNHIDFHHQINGIDYIEINSLSYHWMGARYQSTERYPQQLYQQYKSLPMQAPYKDPLYAFATVDPKGSLSIEGVRSEWVLPSPEDLGMPTPVYGSGLSPNMSDYYLKF